MGSTGSAPQGIPIEVAPEAKDESDTELAILAAVRRGADRLTIVGGLGGRPDHLLANIVLLGHPALGDRPIELLDDKTRVTLLRGPARRRARRPGRRPRLAAAARPGGRGRHDERAALAA